MVAPLIAAGVFGAGLANNFLANEAAEEEKKRNDKAIESLYFDPAGLYANYQYYNDPLLYDTYLLDDTAYNNISVDPSVLYAQNKALDELINLSESKGLNAIDQQALQEIVDTENRNLKSQQDAIMQDAMQRGVYGSGLEMAQRLQAAQSSANRMNNQDMNVMAQAQQRALDALSNYGNLASNMRSQDFGEQEKIANANDLINKANWENRQNVSNSNIDNRNKVNMAKTEIYNKQQDSDVNSYLNYIKNNFDRVALKTNQYGTNLQNVRDQEKSNNNLIGTLSSSIGSFVDNSNNKKENQ